VWFVVSYVEIVNFVFTIALGIMGLTYCHFVVFAIVGIFFKKKFPKTEKKLKYACVVSARNEETVVGNLVQSIKNSKYPQELIDVFIVAHNSQDKTAEVARKAGAIVYEYNNEKECTKGYALKHLFSKIEEDYGTQNYDGFFLLDADNLVDADYFDRMNDAFIAQGQKNIITSFRNTKNFGTNIISALYGLFFLYTCRLESRGRTALGISTRVQGTGCVFPKEVVKDGWNYVTLTEDWEFSADQIIQGNKICYCEDAMFYDEQPTTIKVMWRQRIRWAKGHLLVCLTRFKQLMKALFGSKKEGSKTKHYKKSVYDISINILPVCIISVALTLLQVIFLLVCPFFGCDLGSTMFGELK
jgi:cellulose synthase/poly-beta-1,6-N-acetylglucosamine synthase-like glycosyltransferase